jgi:simple sugar transport system permease protein
LIFFTGGKYITSLPKFFRDGIWWFEYDDASGTPYALNLQILVLVLVFLSAWLLLNQTNIGHQIYALGGNKDAAQRLGFHVSVSISWSTAIWASSLALPRWCRPGSRDP